MERSNCVLYASGNGFKFLVMGTRLLMWMASASNEVESKGSTMYNTPNILAQLVSMVSATCQECVTSQSNLLTLLIRKCVTHFLLSGNTLADLGHNQGGILSMVWAIGNQLVPTQGHQNCDVYHAGVTMCYPGSYTCYVRNSAHGHQPKGGQSCEDGA